MQILNGYKNVLVGNRIDIKQDIKEIRYNFKPVSLNWWLIANWWYILFIYKSFLNGNIIKKEY